MDVVFHCATAAPSASNAVTNEKLMYDVNVVGTEHVIWACQQLGIRKLVYTSSASVVFEGRDLLDVDESAPYAKPMDFYTNTKASLAGQALFGRPRGSGALRCWHWRPAGEAGPRASFHHMSLLMHEPSR